MAQAEIKETLKVPKDKLFQAITQYEEYPKFVQGCKAVKVERPSAGKAKVTYDISMMKDISYTLEHTEDLAAGKITWQLVQSSALKKNTGHWEIRETSPGQCEVKYAIDIDFNFFAPGFVVKQLVQSSLPAMLRSFEQRARSL